MARTGYVEIPGDWIREQASRLGPFVTREVFRRPDGSLVTWESRLHRKWHNRLDRGRGSTWWAPGAIGWWIGVLFMIGSTCFALGAVPGYLDAVGTDADNITFFVGSIFFTSAGFLQYLEVANASRAPGRPVRQRVRVFSWEPHRIDWVAATVQLFGTLCFNISTFSAMQSGLDPASVNQLVWRPDVYGSICFLVASGLAWLEVGHHWLSWRPRVTSWWIALLNLAGSVAFGVSAFAAKVVSSSGELRKVELVNLGTFLGALGFLVGAFLLLPERTASAEELIKLPSPTADTGA
ncbi:MAG: hypothetical protein ACXWWX_06070 [Actinomycetota bacterium]